MKRNSPVCNWPAEKEPGHSPRVVPSPLGHSSSISRGASSSRLKLPITDGGGSLPNSWNTKPPPESTTIVLDHPVGTVLALDRALRLFPRTQAVTGQVSLPG